MDAAEAGVVVAVKEAEAGAEAGAAGGDDATLGSAGENILVLDSVG